MNSNTYQVDTVKIEVKKLKQAPMLKKYGIENPSEFEITQLNKFGLTDQLKGVIATGTGVVLCNWEQVLIAKASGIQEIEVTVIQNLTEDEIPQIVSLTNIRKRLKKKPLANLIIDLKEYLTQNPTGKEWASEILGNSIERKIGVLVGYSYGMIAGYMKIYKYHPEFLEAIDNGEMSFTGALRAIDDEARQINGPDGDIVPKKTKAPKHSYAGERNMVLCEPMESILIRYSDGRTIEILIHEDNSTANILGVQYTPDYSYKKENFPGGAEFHRIETGDKNTFLEITVKKAA